MSSNEAGSSCEGIHARVRRVFGVFVVPAASVLLSPARNLPDPVDVGGGDKKADLQPKHGRAVWQIRVRVQHVCDGSRSDSSASEVRL